MNAQDQLVSVTVTLTAFEGAAQIGAVTPLFTPRIAPGGDGVPRQQYVVSPDGTRFLVSTVVPQPALPITLLLNWRGWPRP